MTFLILNNKPSYYRDAAAGAVAQMTGTPGSLIWKLALVLSMKSGHIYATDNKENSFSIQLMRTFALIGFREYIYRRIK